MTLTALLLVHVFLSHCNGGEMTEFEELICNMIFPFLKHQLKVVILPTCLLMVDKKVQSSGGCFEFLN